MLYSSARQLLAALGWRTRACFRSDQRNPLWLFTKAKVPLLQLYIIIFLIYIKVQFLLLYKQFNPVRQVQYLANGVKVENPVYILSNEVLKFIYDSYEAIMQIFNIV